MTLSSILMLHSFCKNNQKALVDIHVRLSLLEDSRSFQRRSEVATSPRRNMMSEVIVKASHLERINGVHGGSCVTQGITTKTKPTIIYNYDRRLLKPHWDWINCKEFLPTKRGSPIKTCESQSNCGKWRLRGTGRAMGFTWLHYVVLPTSSNMGFKRSWNHGKHQKTWENMGKTWTPSEPV